ncbi:RecX family transcriptional regulator [Ignavigranum ruoffiae]|uniref:RecX family transcriptional regulator n=1 Tax=Ignavigranum ruoffiae TaxID=89093 RepID=UPI0020630ED0|nr:RecX family transcriptional regulator [Ignavigranum ruoffiae]UPQ85196.1 RecX family transcriptional regulator [Ignavigranum ruoffiae]
MIISKIEKQSKRANRYNLYVDGKFYLGIDENILVKYALYKGLEVTPDRLAHIRYDEEVNKYYNQALNYLSYGLRTVNQMRQYLHKHLPQDRASREEDIEHILNKLRDQALVDDVYYGQAYVRTKMRINRKGPLLIEQELRQKGLNAEKIQLALAEYPLAQGQENLRHLAEKFTKKHRKLSRKMQSLKLNQHLQSKGYAQDWIASVDYHDLLTNDVDDQELVEAEATKLYQRKSRIYQGNQLKQIIRQNLYRKGFNQDDIESCLQDHLDWFAEK